MNRVYIYKKFFDDIIGHGDATFARRIVSCIRDEVAGSANVANDHRYEGIENAWIRYVSRGQTGYRIIYIKDDGNTLFYRCGSHDVEDRLRGPSDNDDVVALDILDDEKGEMTKPLTILSNHETPLLYGAILNRKLIPNKNVYLISPFIDEDLLYRGTRMGGVLDAMVRDGAEVVIITSTNNLIKFEKLWRDLEARRVEVMFLRELHSKIYLFITNSDYDHDTANTPSLGIVGSSNLTKYGVSEELHKGNYETNYSVAEQSIDDLERTAMKYYMQSLDYRRAKKLRKRI